VLELVYETHSLTTDNEEGVATGWLPGRLSAAGREQARQLGQRRRKDRIAAVFTFPGGESYQQVVERTRGFLDHLRRDWEGRRVCVVAHSANRWALDHLLHGIPLEELVDAPFAWRAGWEYRL
jgi:broad specificity phosphatase PhoE